MHGICEKCTNAIAGDFVKCDGFCSCTVCLPCSGLTTELHNAVKNKVHLLWMCTACRNLLAKTRFSNALVSVNAANESLIDALKNEMRENILADIRTEIRTNFKTLIESIPSTPGPSKRLQPVRSISAKRQRETEAENDDDPACRRPAKLLCGTGAHDSNISGTLTSNQVSDNKFWLYLSGIQPDVTDENVSDMVRTNLNCNELKVVKLVPKGKDLRTLTFISFKVGMPVEFKDKAMSADTWPVGIRFREFEDIGTSRPVFWRPTALNSAPPMHIETPKTAN